MWKGALPVATLVFGVVMGSTLSRVVQSPPGPAAGPSVTGIGGVFLRAEDPAELREWYRVHLDIDAGPHGADFLWRDSGDPDVLGRTVWSLFPEDTDYFGPGDQEAMINYRVRDLDALLERLRRQGVEQIGETEEYPYGRFAWIVDGEGNWLELWEPVYASSQDPEAVSEQSVSGGDS